MPFSPSLTRQLLAQYTNLIFLIFLLLISPTISSSSSAPSHNHTLDTRLLFLTPHISPDFASFSSSFSSSQHDNDGMSVLDEHAAAWHPGESAVRAMLRVPPDLNPTARGLPRRYALRAAASPLAALGALDAEGRPWCTVWGGERRAAMQPLAPPGVLGVAGRAVDARYDPVLRALFAGAEREADGALAVRPPRDGGGGGGGERRQLMAGLSIDLETRDRVKLEGRLLAGALTETSGGGGDGSDGGGGEKALADVQLAMLVEGSLGNCPKYLNRRAVRPHVPAPRLVSDALPLPPAAVALLARADLFFLSSTDGRTMDVNHRGGGAGFVRVARNEDRPGGVALVYPEFSGNRLYQTLGNLHVRPQVGVAVPDFDSGDVLYLTGEAAILVGDRAAAYLPRARLAVRIDVRAARFVADGLPFRGGGPVDFSPYSPPAWKLASEGASGAGAAAAGVATATLTKKEVLTPSIARFTFRLEGVRGSDSIPTWLPGQHVTMDFSEDLDAGYSHMRDDDPQSLNDDYIRTFTVSSSGSGAAPPPLPPPAKGGVTTTTTTTTAEFEITVRRHGPVTGWLFSRNPRAGLEVSVLGFGGEEAFRIPIPTTTATTGAEGEEEGEADEAYEHVYVAGGVGITPLLAQAPRVLAAAAAGRSSSLRLLWALRAEDLGLAVDAFRRIPGLAGATTLFVTGAAARVGGEWEAGLLQTLEELGTGSIKTGRMTREDVLEYKDGKARQHGRRKYYVCAGPGLVKELVGWLEREDMVMESFAY